MIFSPYKNALVYLFTEMPALVSSVASLNEALSKKRHTPIKLDARSSFGFTHPFNADNSDDVAIQIDQYIHLAYFTEEKVIDRDTINARVDEAVSKIEAEGREVNGETKNTLFNQYESELMPFFKVRRSIIHAYIDIKRQAFIVDAANTNVGDEIARAIRSVVDSFPVQLIKYNLKPCRVLSHAIHSETSLKALEFGDGKHHAKYFPEPKEEKTEQIINGFLPSDIPAFVEYCGRTDLIVADLYTTVVSNNESMYLGFTLKSLPNTQRSNKPDAIFTAISLGMDKTYREEEVNGAVFEFTTLMGIIIDRTMQEFGCDMADQEYFDDGEDDGAWLKDLVVQVSAAREERAKQRNIQVFGGEEEEPLFEQAKAFVVEERRPSVSGLQRKFKIGYNRAARIIERLEVMGVVSEPNNNGIREVLISAEEATNGQ